MVAIIAMWENPCFGIEQMVGIFPHGYVVISAITHISCFTTFIACWNSIPF